MGDTRRGWVDSYQLLLDLSSDERFSGPVEIEVDLSDVRPVGETLKGFGGMANPVKLKDSMAGWPKSLTRHVAVSSPPLSAAC